jgi:molecular chaperone HtpG
MAQMQFDFDGLITLLAQHLYSEKKVFIRELVQNAHDSIMRLRARVKDLAGRIDIETRPKDDLIIFRDNGIGMSREDLVEFLSNVGKSGTRQEHDQIPGLIGQFGIGFLSGFLVAGQIEVRTKKYGEHEAWLWSNAGRADYEITPCTVDFDHGAEVTLRLKSIEHRGLIHSEEVQKVVRLYADMLPVEIRIDGIGPVNTQTMPWEKRGLSDEERRLECHLYVEKTMRDSVLEAIPVALSMDADGVDAAGVLYITKTRVFAIDAPRNVRVFQKRMFLCENAPEILPKWAIFVNGVLDAPTLTPTAARDTFIRNSAAERLADALGSLVIRHLEALQRDDPERLGEILSYHSLSLKAACNYHEEFGKKFIHLLQWRTNNGVVDENDPEKGIRWRTLPEVLAALSPRADGELQPIPCFTTHSSANQYFQMANAAGQVVIDASSVFEGELLEKYVKMDGIKARLLYVDRVDDPNVFRRLGSEDAAVERLAVEMAHLVVVGRERARLRVEARRFDPPELEAVIRVTERAKSVSKAQSVLNDPNAPDDLREMARDLIRKTRHESQKLTINAANPFIRSLAQTNFRDDAFLDLVLGIYNNAILYNAELMTPENAKIFHDHFGRLLERTLGYVIEKASLDRARAELARDREKLDGRTAARLPHRVFFMMTPFDRDRYGATHEALRTAVEDHWRCQLFLASDRAYDQRLLENVRMHMDQADAFIAEVSDANPNVLFELGAVFEKLRDRPVVLLRRTAINGAPVPRPALPADLQGLLYVDYDPSLPADELAKFFEGELRKTDCIDRMLKNPQRERFVSARAVRDEFPKIKLDEKSVQKISDHFRTIEGWAKASEKEIAALVEPADRQFAGIVLSQMQSFEV